MMNCRLVWKCALFTFDQRAKGLGALPSREVGEQSTNGLATAAIADPSGHPKAPINNPFRNSCKTAKGPPETLALIPE